MSFIAIIPARLHSTRLPNKPLADIAGLPMVVRTAHQAQKSGASAIYVATDSKDIAKAASQHHITALLTSPHHPTGTDRLAEVVNILQLADDEIVVNVQGDEPLIPPELIQAVAKQLQKNPMAAIATAATVYKDDSSFFNPNTVKVVCDLQQRALYFSRAPIPWARDALQDNPNKIAPELRALNHIGIYAYRARFLRQYPQLPRGPLETLESLEQLRALENGFSISVYIHPSAPAHGVDTPEDLDKVRQIFENRL